MPAGIKAKTSLVALLTLPLLLWLGDRLLGGLAIEPHLRYYTAGGIALSTFYLVSTLALQCNVIRPIKRLVAYTQRVAPASASVARWRRQGEIRFLARSVSRMARSLRRDQKAISRARDSLLETYERLMLAHDLTQRALLMDHQQDFWPFLAERLTARLSCDRVTIFQRTAKDQLVSRFAQGLSTPVSLEIGEGIAGLAAQTQTPFLSNDPYSNKNFSPAVDRLTDYKTENILAFPLAYQGRAVGVVELLNKKGGFTDEDVSSMEYLGSQVAICFVKFKVEEKQEEMTRQMVQAEKMAAVGRLAGGVAHEINNPLSAILGFTQLLLRTSGDRPELAADLLKIDAEARRIRTIVHNLLGFSRISPSAFSTIRLHEILEASLDLIGHELRHRKVEITKELDSSLPPIIGDTNNLKQVFINLILNALQAMDGRPGPARLLLRVYGAQTWACAEVTDNGPGIAAEVLDKIFEPFFTTKEVGKGTGLGLYVTSGIVERHKGLIEVDAAPERGTTFRLKLPLPSGGKASSS